MLHITYLDTSSISAIQHIANLSWEDTYASILTRQQMDFMLQSIYSTESLTRQMEIEAHTFCALMDDLKAIGFCSFSLIDKDASLYKLHKLYLLPDQKGKGAGKKFLAFIEAAIVEKGGKKIRLNVNRNNPALQFYQRNDFKIMEEVDIAIGEF